MEQTNQKNNKGTSNTTASTDPHTHPPPPIFQLRCTQHRESISPSHDTPTILLRYSYHIVYLGRGTILSTLHRTNARSNRRSLRYHHDRKKSLRYRTDFVMLHIRYETYRWFERNRKSAEIITQDGPQRALSPQQWHVCARIYEIGSKNGPQVLGPHHSSQKNFSDRATGSPIPSRSKTDKTHTRYWGPTYTRGAIATKTNQAARQTGSHQTA